ncbi:MAG: serine/threonine-protein kinase, partial [Steroidobacteraceae bacterium]
MQHDDPQFTNTLPSGGQLAGGDEGARAPATEHKPLEPGDTIGRYRVRERIGEGGMGVVYAAEDPELGRVVAIKLLRPVQGAEAEREQRRMLREAQALARVSHRNLVMVFDVGSLRGRVWIAMEYVAGETLETWLSREHRSWSEIVGVFAEAGRGLAAVHAAGLVHRDYKPDNVLVDESGCARVLDFGLVHVGEALPTWSSGEHALAVDDGAETLAGDLVGTPPYMAPEQLDGASVDARGDQFAFCVSLFEALHGCRPFPGRTPAELRAAIAAGVIARPSDGGDPDLAAIDAVLRRGLSRDPADRFADMDALVDALEHARTARRQAARLELERRARTLDLFSRSDLRMHHVVLVGAILMAIVASLAVARRMGLYEIGYPEATACGAAFVVLQALLERRHRRRSAHDHDERWSRAAVVGTAVLVSSLPLAWLAGLPLAQGLMLLTFGFACSIGVIGLMTDARVLPASAMLLLTA